MWLSEHPEHVIITIVYSEIDCGIRVIIHSTVLLVSTLLYDVYLIAMFIIPFFQMGTKGQSITTCQRPFIEWFS